MSKKKSPRSIPRTQQDVDRAKEKGRMEGINGALIIFLYTLMNNFGAGDEELQKFADAFNDTLDSINRGYVTEADLKNVVREEYHTELRVK